LLAAASLLIAVDGQAQPRDRAAAAEPAPIELFPAPLVGPLPDPSIPEGLADLSSESCGGCHREVHAQWASSGHARAFTSPLFQWAWSEAGRGNACLDCHAPLLSQRADAPEVLVGDDPERDRSVPNPSFRPLLRNEGVGCAACHLRAGQVLGPRPVTEGSAPHPVRAVPAMRDSAIMCAPCHQRVLPGHEDKALYDTWAEWADSPFAAAGIHCQDCHMPLTAGEIAAGRFDTYPDHSTPGAPSSLASGALDLDLRLSKPWFNRGDKGEAVLRVTNRNAAHRIPTGDPFHRVQVRMELGQLEGVKGGSQELWLGRDIQRRAPWKERSDTRLRAGESAQLELSFSSKANMEAARLPLTVEIWYHAVAPEELPDELRDLAPPVLLRSETVELEFR
jgi:hypothetical protein